MAVHELVLGDHLVAVVTFSHHSEEAASAAGRDTDSCCALRSPPPCSSAAPPKCTSQPAQFRSTQHKAQPENTDGKHRCKACKACKGCKAQRSTPPQRALLAPARSAQVVQGLHTRQRPGHGHTQAQVAGAKAQRVVQHLRGGRRAIMSSITSSITSSIASRAGPKQQVPKPSARRRASRGGPRETNPIHQQVGVAVPNFCQQPSRTRLVSAISQVVTSTRQSTPKSAPAGRGRRPTLRQRH